MAKFGGFQRIPHERSKGWKFAKIEGLKMGKNAFAIGL